MSEKIESYPTPIDAIDQHLKDLRRIDWRLGIVGEKILECDAITGTYKKLHQERINDKDLDNLAYVGELRTTWEITNIDLEARREKLIQDELSKAVMQELMGEEVEVLFASPNPNPEPLPIAS